MKKTLRGIGMVLSLFWLAACSPAVPTSAPTVDLNPVRTQVAATVLAQVTQNLALTPSATLFPSSTATIQPSATQSITATPTIPLSSGTPAPETDNKAKWVSQSIADDTVFAPGQEFTITWRLKNSGVSTWTAKYVLRYYSGDTLGAPKEVAIGQDVAPGAEIEISVQMKAPANPGNYQTNWVMSSENRTNFKEPVFLKIKVAKPATATPTAKP
jgi:hypothetical protein